MKTCPICGTAHNRQGKYCRDACKQDAYRQRNGITKPAFLNNKTRHGLLMPEEERELRLLDIEIEALESVVREQDEEYKKFYRASLGDGKQINLALPTMLNEQQYSYTDSKISGRGLNTKYYRHIDYSNYTFNSSEQLQTFLAQPVYVSAFRQEQVRQQCSAKVSQAFEYLRGIERAVNRTETPEAQMLVQKKRRRYYLIRNADIRKERKVDDGISGADFAKKKFTNLPFDGKWKELLGCPTPSFYGIVWGDAKSGKSFFVLEFAQYLTKFLSGKVAYMSIEEGLEQTIHAKMTEKQAYDVTYFDCTARPENPLPPIQQVEKYLESGFDFVVLDSATKADMDSAFIEKLRLKCPQSAFIAILQTVKGGKNFKGDQNLIHNAGFIVTVERIENGRKKISCTGRFGQGEIIEEFLI